jgi:hypothetical protein
MIQHRINSPAELKNILMPFILFTGIFYFGTGCNSSNNPAPPPSGITVISPKAGDVFKTTDTVNIIRTCNYDDFSSGTYTDCSLDSGKTWDVIKAVVRKSGIVTDTLLWYPSDVYPAQILAGPGIIIKVRDYNNQFVSKTGYFFFSPQ